MSNVASTVDDTAKDLLNISAHHVVATAMGSFSRPVFHPDVVQKFGSPEIARCIAEGLDPRVRHSSMTGKWHSLNAALV
jgi:hypothetical protein